ncbi:hypothetical protein CUC15_19705 [Oceanobacillus zhaokaii]|uniref:Group-specific protein n=1 Tax=Oceanobacillus zhaokaii TaxID=2052660 RepID=A0A345PLY2_9BACI|nr:hypothetical protein [Oceanobacillus zhaokaii]AXI11012.1 hypothetical protein CUC15_19705 [Oceanobacillus zhaokaii]
MLWLATLFLAVVFICHMYILRFNDSEEGTDERGREIQYKTNNMLYGVLYIGVILLYCLVELFEIIPIEYLPDILLWFVLSLGIFGSIFNYINKNRKNY